MLLISDETVAAAVALARRRAVARGPVGDEALLPLLLLPHVLLLLLRLLPAPAPAPAPTPTATTTPITSATAAADAATSATPIPHSDSEY